MIRDYCKKDKVEVAIMRSVVERVAYWYEVIHDDTVRLIDKYLEDGGRRDLSLIVGCYPHRHVRDNDEFITISEYLTKKKDLSKSIGTKRD